MHKRVGWLGLFGALVFTLSACGPSELPQGELSIEEPSGELGDESAELSASVDSYVTLRRDMRRCIFPLCGGYWTTDVNRPWAQTKYVSGLDFKRSGLSADWVAKALEAGDGELVVKGRLGPAERRYQTRALLVSEVYRGLPGVKATASASFYFTQPRQPAIQCFTAPCPNELASRLNRWGRPVAFDRYDMSFASPLRVDQRWLVNRARQHRAVVAGALVDGQQLPGGKEQVLQASQVFVRFPDAFGPCPRTAIRCAAGYTAVFERGEDRCVNPTRCVIPGGCIALAPPACADGYRQVSWIAGPHACPAYACDPAFVLP